MCKHSVNDALYNCSASANTLYLSLMMLMVLRAVPLLTHQLSSIPISSSFLCLPAALLTCCHVWPLDVLYCTVGLLYTLGCFKTNLSSLMRSWCGSLVYWMSSETLAAITSFLSHMRAVTFQSGDVGRQMGGNAGHGSMELIHFQCVPVIYRGNGCLKAIWVSAVHMDSHAHEHTVEQPWEPVCAIRSMSI